ncbi:hypothetical protein N0V93_009743 [Gnomoniopsis smithogilvyi]|uniref:Alkyl hydroperoxide reductase subunit C/ Thiol specific antioxidant domain-containing protein n=1 Tax=Gnomoniopsis smithogilvyi TaxID=1191159 RepID=A0A9W9CSZ0_9PEZI|nr:hypothetical protein N0V93_009743 [Gnomoniopsis smithogilvyi]
MFSSFGTKLALKKLGVPKDAIAFASSSPAPSNTSSSNKRDRKANAAALAAAENDLDDGPAVAWPPKWMSVKSLPLTAQAWLSPPPPPVPVAASCPAVGSRAPVDRNGKLVVGAGKRVMVVFLRCVGCAFAQQNFLALRALSTKAQLSNTSFIAVSHSSPAATQKWLDLLGGAWNVQVIIDEDRSLYAEWGLGLSSVWYYFNPTTQGAAWREKGWLGSRVATSVQRDGGGDGGGRGVGSSRAGAAGVKGEGGRENDGVLDPGLGNKWQEGGGLGDRCEWGGGLGWQG